MANGVLRDDLLSLSGVEHAELDGDPSAPAGIRVRVRQGVDASAVAGEVRRVLAQHGLRPENAARVESPPSPDRNEEPSIEPPPADAGHVSTAEAVAAVGLLAVGISEGVDGVTVTAAGPAGDVSVRAAGWSIPAIDQAIVVAVAELAGAATAPLICSVDERDLDGTSVVTVVIEESGVREVGSAVVRSGRAYAVGRAVWAALSSR